MLSGRMPPSRENRSTMMLDAMAPANANSAIAPMPMPDADPASAGTTTMMARLAPNEAPWEIPTVDAEARGFSSTLWRTAPAKASPEPATRAHTTRGSLIERTAATSVDWPWPNSAAMISPMPMPDAPQESSAAADASMRATRTAMVAMHRRSAVRWTRRISSTRPSAGRQAGTSSSIEAFMPPSL